MALFVQGALLQSISLKVRIGNEAAKTKSEAGIIFVQLDYRVAGMDGSRVARFFFAQHTKTGKSIPMATKNTKWQ
jgi:hypothetical protein